MAEFCCAVERGNQDSVTRQGMQNIRGLHRKGLGEWEKKDKYFFMNRAHKQVLTMK